MTPFNEGPFHDIMNFIGGIIKLDNIIIKKNWEEDNLLELKVKAKSKFVNAYQYCYIQGNELQNIGETIIDYVQKNNQECYVEFGEKTGNYTHAFSLQFLQADKSGHVQIEVDIEIDDNDARSHRCTFYVNSELGLIEQFGKRLTHISKDNKMTEIALNERP